MPWRRPRVPLAFLSSRRSAASPRKPPLGGWKVQNEREPADRSDTDSGTGDGIGEVVPSQADDGDSDDASQHACCCRDQYAQRPCRSRLRRDEKHHRDRGGKREHGCGMPARIGEDPPIGAVDQGLEQAFVQSDGTCLLPGEALLAVGTK